MAAAQAVILSGGGSKGDFQVGAVRALYDAGVVPRILIGTSVGAINAAKLAEGEDAADATRGLAGLERIWGSLRFDEDMSVPAPWLAHPEKDLDPDVVSTLLGTGDASMIGADAPVPPMQGDTSLGWLSYAWNGFRWLQSDGRLLLETLQTVSRQSQIFSLDPIRKLAGTLLNPQQVAEWAASGGRLLLAVVSLDSGRLRYVTETGALVERDLTTPVPDLEKVSAACQPLAAEIAALEREIQAVQNPLDPRSSIKEVKALQGRKREALQKLTECARRNPVPAVVDLSAGVLASSAIPVLFGLEKLAGEMYGDAGIRELVPIQAAIDLGADDVFAVSASPIGLTSGSYQGARIADIAGRVLDVMLAEVAADDLRPTGGTQVRLIAPDEEVHGIRTIDPGLIQINRDYGYMRAADVLSGASPGDPRWASATRIMRARVAIWERENATAGQPDARHPGTVGPAADPTLQAHTTELKAALGELLDNRRQLGGAMPAGIDRWRIEPELHRWSQATSTGGTAAEFVQQSAPFPSGPGQTGRVSVTMRNSGNATWTSVDRVRLGAVNDDTRWGIGRVDLPHPVRPEEQVTFEFDVNTPELPAPYQWRMVQEGVEWFGEPSPPTVLADPSTPVRYGTAFQLRHLATGRALHSHLHNWSHPGGSGQQQVTCYGGGDANDEWRVKGPHGEPFPARAGIGVTDGDVIRLEHVASRRNLHSHNGFASPVTGQQEITCFGTDGVGDGNDNWRVVVDGGGDWLAGRRIRLIHVGTGIALHSHVGHSHPVWTFGQQEVSGYAGRDFNDWWSASDFRARDAVVASTRLPTTMVTREVMQLVIAMVNVGTMTWRAAGSIRLGSQDPQDNMTWGIGRVNPPATIPPGQTATFAFGIIAPAALGRRTCHWRMLDEGVEWFGDTSEGSVLVTSSAAPTTVPDVVGMERVLAANAIRAAELVPRFTGGMGSNAAEVSSQTPTPGASVARGTVVTLSLRRP